MEFKINDRNSLNWYYEYKETSAESYEKAEHKTYLTYSFSPYLSATVHYNKHTYKSIYQDNTDDEWFGGELLINPVSGLAISLFYGELPPGMVCSGGQCRIVPEFEGFQASLSYRF